MSSQYDEIGSKYIAIKELVTSVIDEENVKHAIQPYLTKISKPRVLDLASGTGYYSKKMIDWGADYVLGVDQSVGMVDTARSLLATRDLDKYASKIRFEVGDALSQGRFDGESQFDIVIGCWLLNYASSLEDMTKMFRTISANLKKGGVFVGLTPSVTDDVDAQVKLWLDTKSRIPPDSGFPVQLDYLESLPSGEGWKVEISSTGAGGEFSFRNFHLKKGIYEQGARSAGFDGKLEWPEVRIPERAQADLEKNDYWRIYMDGCGGSHMGIIILEK